MSRPSSRSSPIAGATDRMSKLKLSAVPPRFQRGNSSPRSEKCSPGASSPPLLATSVGKDSGLLPSSSSISLLSLNAPLGVSAHRQLNSHRYPGGTRRGSFGTGAEGSGIFMPKSPSASKLRHSTSPPVRAIQINRAVPLIPGSPPLQPTSVDGSPSCFFLTDHSPPSSLQSNVSYMNLQSLHSLGGGLAAADRAPRMPRSNSFARATANYQQIPNTPPEARSDSEAFNDNDVFPTMN